MISPSAQLKKASAKIAPAVILVTTFDSSGKLLRTGTGFFAERDGRLIATLDLVQGAAYAVAKTSDGKIRNVTGVIASLPSAGLAVLRAETKTGVPFVSLSKTTESTSPVALVGSSLQHREQPLGALQMAARRRVSEAGWMAEKSGFHRAIPTADSKIQVFCAFRFDFALFWPPSGPSNR